MLNFLLCFGLPLTLTAGCTGWVVWYLFQSNLFKGDGEFRSRYLHVGKIGVCVVLLFSAYSYIHLQHASTFGKKENAPEAPPEIVYPKEQTTKKTVYRGPTITAPQTTRKTTAVPTVTRKQKPISPSPGWNTEGKGSLPHEPEPLDIPEQKEPEPTPVVARYTPPPKPKPEPVYQDVIGEDLKSRSEVRKVTLSPHYWYILTSSYLSSPIWFDGTEPPGSNVRVRVNDGTPVTVTANSTVSLNSRMRKVAFQSGESRDITIYITKKRSIVRAKVDSKSVLESSLESVGATFSVNTSTLPRTPTPSSNDNSTTTTRTFRYSTRSARQPSTTQSRSNDPYSSQGHAARSNVRLPSNQATNKTPARPGRSQLRNRGEPRANRDR